MKLVHLTKNDFLTGDFSPVNKVTPDFVGQFYIQGGKLVYIATNLNSTDWLALQPLLTDLGDAEEVGELITNLSKDVEELKPLLVTMEDVTSDVESLQVEVGNQPSVADIHSILKEVISLTNYYTKKPIDNKFLVYDTLIDDLQRRTDALELKANVGCMGITVPKELKLTSNDPVALDINLSPYNTTDILEFTSTNAHIVTVDRGILQPQGVNGSAIIKLTCGNRKAECVVTVELKEEVESTDNLISTSDELYVRNDYLVAPIVSSIPSHIQIKYLMWELVYNDTILSVGTFQANEKLLNKIMFNCKYLNPLQEYTGVKIVAKKYDPTTNTFEVVGTSNDITIKF